MALATCAAGHHPRPAAAAPGSGRRGGGRLQNGRTLTIAMTESDQRRAQTLIDEYAATRRIDVDVQAFSVEGLLEKLTIHVTQVTGAYDVVSMDDAWIPQFAGGEFLKNLENLGYSSDPDFVPELLALGDFPAGSGPRAIPWVGNIQVFAWRTDVLEELGLAAPTTWDEVLETATAISDANRDADLYGFGLQSAAGNPAATGFLPVLRGHGIDLFDENWEPQLDRPEALTALTLVLALKGVAPPGTEDAQEGDIGANFVNGRIAMSGDVWPNHLLQIFDPEVTQVGERVKIGPEPAQREVARTNMAGGWLLGIPEGSQNADQALDFITWITSRQRQKRLLVEMSLPPTRMSVMHDEEAVQRLPVLPDLLQAARRATPRPRTPYYTAVEAIFGRHVAEAMAGQSDPEVALQSANREIRDLMVREGVLDKGE